MTPRSAASTVELEAPAAGIVVVRLNRPAVHNAIDQTMIDELDRALDEIVERGDARVAIVTGSGRSFSSGHDLRTDRAPDEGGLSRPSEVQQRWTYERAEFFEKTLRLFHLPVPTIALVRGHCLAAGLSLALACDLVYADPTARFGDPVLRMGALGAEAFLLPWLTGVRQAKELLLTGNSIDAERALRTGLVNDVLPADEAEPKVLEVARKVAELPPFAARMMKRSLNLTLDHGGMPAWLEHHFDAHVLMHATAEASSIMDGSERPARASEFVRRRDEGFGGR